MLLTVIGIDTDVFIQIILLLKVCLQCPSFTKTSKYYYLVVKTNILLSHTFPILHRKNNIAVGDISF
jgi:hypothetical protein